MKGRVSLKFSLGVIIAVLLLAEAPQAIAQGNSGQGWMIRARGIAVVPDESSTVTPIGGEIDIDNAVMPEVDITYFFNENIALELIAATSPHDAKANGTTLGNLDLGDFWIMPPTLLAQYHLPLGDRFKPYIGAGINYTITYGEDAAGGAVTGFELDNGLGWAAQIGVDYMLDEHWLINADIKKVWLNLDAKVNGGAVRADIDVDPWIFGVGVGYRF